MLLTPVFTAQVIAANIAVNTDGKVEVIPGTNQVVPALSGPIPQGNPQLAQQQINQLPPQPIVSFSNPAQTPHNQLVQPPMASFAPGMQGPTQIAAQQSVSFPGPIMAAAIGGRCPIQTASVPGDIRQSSVGSMGPAVPLPQPTLVYTRTTDNMPLVSSIVPASGHKMALVADRSRNSVSSMPGPLHVTPHGGQQGFNSVSPASQAMVQPPSHQNNGALRFISNITFYFTHLHYFRNRLRTCLCSYDVRNWCWQQSIISICIEGFRSLGGPTYTRASVSSCEWRAA